MAAQIQIQLTSEDDLMSSLATGGCKVVEVYSDWCGPCKSVLPTCKKLRLEGKDEEVLTFLTIAAETCRQHEQAKEHQGKSEPLFLVYRNGTLKAKVHGANMPSLIESINEWLTMMPAQDDLEENPFYIAMKGDKDGSSKDASKQKTIRKK